MAFEGYSTKQSVVLVYTGEGKGKTSAAVGLMARALGNGWQVAFIQFIKHWTVGEHNFIADIQPIYAKKLFFYKGGKGFYNAGEISAQDVTPEEHRIAAELTFETAMRCASSGEYNLVICDEINNAVHDGLLSVKDMAALIRQRNSKTSLCLTGRNFPKALLKKADIATEMRKIKHHFDDQYLANQGIDF